MKSWPLACVFALLKIQPFSVVLENLLLLSFALEKSTFTRVDPEKSHLLKSSLERSRGDLSGRDPNFILVKSV